MDGAPAGSVAGQGDHPTGLALFGAIMLALYERETTGKGRMVHTSLVRQWSLVQRLFRAGARWLCPEGRTQPREARSSALVNTYRARDGRWFIFSALQPDRDWAAPDRSR